jgi:hypothetical protein
VPLEALAVPEPGLGAFTVEIDYAGGIVTPTSYDGNPNGDLDMVTCNLNLVPGATISCTGISASGAPDDSLLANITFQAVGQPGDCSSLSLNVLTLADPNGNDIPFNSQDGSLCVAGTGTSANDWDGPSVAVSAGQATAPTVTTGGNGLASLLSLVLSPVMFLSPLMISAMANRPLRPRR